MTAQPSGVDVRGLCVHAGGAPLVHDLSLQARPGSITAIVGESGAGKTVTVRALLGLLPRGLRAEGTVDVAGRTIALSSTGELARLRGTEIGIVMQNPFGSLDPLVRTGRQLIEPIRRNGSMSIESGEARAVELLQRMGFSDPDHVRDLYPHELSGGMSQRVAIAAAMMLSPRVLIADEPTSALDAHLRIEVLRLLQSVTRSTDTAVLLISHDLGLVSRFADEIVVMKDGRCVEAGSCPAVLSDPRDEYTMRLLRSSLTLSHPRRRPVWLGPGAAGPGRPTGGGSPTGEGDQAAQVGGPVERVGTDEGRGGAGSRDPVVRGERVSRRFRTRYGPHSAVADVDLGVRPGETVAVVGESGSGKTTLARLIAGLDKPTSGTVRVLGQPPRPTPGRPSAVQMVFQNPKDALNSHWSVGRSIAEPCAGLGQAQRKARVADLLAQVGLEPAIADRRPATFSGGQLQRIGIARALAADPAVLLCDEPTSALDVTVQAQIVNLLLQMQEERGFAMVLVTHDLGVVRVLADRVVVLYRGRVVESADSDSFFAGPADPYAAALVDAVAEQSLTPLP